MRVNLLIDNHKGILNGYLNIDPFATGQDERKVGEVVTLDHLIDDGEAEQLIARHILEYFPLSAQRNILHNWLKKVKKGGEFIYEQTDFESVCIAFYMGKVNATEAQELLYGKQDKSWNIKKSGLSLLPFVQFLEGSGFKIIHKRLAELNFCVKAIRL